VSEEKTRRGHLPGCEVVTFQAMRERWLHEGKDVSGLPEPIEGAGLMKCAPGCPNLEAGLARGRELAEIHGW